MVLSRDGCKYVADVFIGHGDEHGMKENGGQSQIGVDRVRGLEDVGGVETSTERNKTMTKQEIKDWLTYWKNTCECCGKRGTTFAGPYAGTWACDDCAERLDRDPGADEADVRAKGGW